MKKGINLLAICLTLVGSVQTLNAQEAANEKANVDARVSIFLTIPGHNDLNQKYSFGGGGTVGMVIEIPQIKTSIVPQFGMDFMPRSVGTDDTYRETIFFTNIGLEVMHQVFASNQYKLIPFVVIDSRNVTDRYLEASGDLIINSNGTTELDYNKLPPIFKSSAVAFSFGIENRISNYGIRISYEMYNPQVTANLNDSYDDIDQEIFASRTRKMNLSMIKVGVGFYFW